ncbi:glycosyltransferase family 2 protein [Sulfurovum sp. NBC37-1]|uniref:glycosyltransferase family 2 protein n=1 Tax=Sulfurovum sp. (strain NBC37-1) TaxID=387093 RepID=UPI0001587B63|nr:glycosyltransferase family 2 protein [Sulfurovum sp. NBC37-1]BAF72488.1 glycosyl transferase [Sulfurovum sp. NBC37-1]
MNNILIIVPAYNEEKNIENVIKSLIKNKLSVDIIVINDGSIDNTSEKAKKTGDATVIDLPGNVGIGGAVQTGFKFAYRNNYDIAIQFDGDGQHNSSQINKIIQPIIENTADCVIGSRFIGDKRGFQSTKSRRIGIKILEFINSILIKQRITDNTSGFRAYNRNIIELFAKDYPSDFPEPEAVIILGKQGYRILEVPVMMNERTAGNSSISGFKSAYYMIKVILSIFMTYLGIQGDKKC